MSNTDNFEYVSYDGEGYPLEEKALSRVNLEEKVNPAYGALTTISDVPQPHTLPRNYKAYAQEGYIGNDTVFKVVNYICANGGAIPPKLYTDRTMKTEITKHELLDRLDQPNVEITGVEYREAILGYLLIAGNSYQYAIRKGIKGPPDELWTLQPDKVKLIPSRSRGIIGFKYDDFPEEKSVIDPANIGRVRFWHPSDALYGASPVEVAAILIDQQSAAKKWNLALLQNFAKPSGVWVAPTALSPNDYNRTLEKLQELMAGFVNAGKTQLLDAGMTWQQTGMSPTDVDWLEGLRYNSGAIANIFNIAPQLIGDTSSSTYDNMDQAKAASYTEGIFPVLDKLYALWNNWLVPMYPDLQNAYLYYDKETVEVVQAIIQAKNTAKITQATQIYLAGGIDLFTYQMMCGTTPDPHGKGIYRVGQILVASDKLSEFAEQILKTTLPAVPMSVSDTTQHALLSPKVTVTEVPNTGKKKSSSRKVEELQKLLERKIDVTETQTGVGSASYLLWMADADACDFCMMNDGQIVIEGEAFENGVSYPGESHPFCQCEAIALSLPDDVLVTDLADLEDSDIIDEYGTGEVFHSRHAQDVADQQKRETAGKILRLEALREKRRNREAYSTVMVNYLKTRKTIERPEKKPTSKISYRQYMNQLLDIETKFNDNHDAHGRFASGGAGSGGGGSVTASQVLTPKQLGVQLNTAQTQWEASLTQIDNRTLTNYALGEAFDLNNHLRGKPVSDMTAIKKENLQFDAKNLNEAILKAPGAPQDMTVYRGFSYSSMQAQDNQLVSTFKAKIGQTFTDAGFSSTTIDSHVANTEFVGLNHGVTAEIQIPQGSKGAYIAHWGHSNESQYLLPTNSQFTVKSVTETTPGFTKIQLQYIGPKV